MDLGGSALFLALVLSQPAAPAVSAWDGVFTDEQARRGDAVYARACGSCHGGSFEGTEMAAGLADATFQANWNGLTLGDLFDRIRETMPPEDPGQLSRDETADVLALLLEANRFPPGEEPLANRARQLRRILFDPYSR